MIVKSLVQTWPLAIPAIGMGSAAAIWLGANLAARLVFGCIVMAMVYALLVVVVRITKRSDRRFRDLRVSIDQDEGIVFAWPTNSVAAPYSPYKVDERDYNVVHAEDGSEVWTPKKLYGN